MCKLRHVEGNEDPNLALTERQMLDALSRMPFVDSTELALMLGEPHATVHRGLADLMAEGIVGRVNHGTAHLPSNQRYHLTAQGIKQAAGILGVDTPDETLRTLLHLAAAGIPDLSSPEFITLLLDAGAAINAADKAGDTPLHLAAAHVRTQITETVKLLLARGADNYVSDTACKVARGTIQGNGHFSRNGPPGGARTPRRGRGGRNHKVPNHISKTVLSTVHLGPLTGTRTT